MNKIYWHMNSDEREATGVQIMHMNTHNVATVRIFIWQFSYHNPYQSEAPTSARDSRVAFGLLEAGTHVADVARNFEGNESTIYCLQPCFRQSGSEKDRPRSGRQWITTPREVRFMVTSSRRNLFMAAPKRVERLRHATETLIYLFTARKRLRAAGLKFEF